MPPQALVLLLGLAASLPLWGPPARAQGEPSEVPKYLALARELVANTKPEDNRYSLGSQFISFPGDFLSNRHAVRADCSGFLLAILHRADYQTQWRMEYLPSTRRRTRPAAEDFVYSIENEKGFTRVRDARGVQPGDLLAHAMLNAEDQRQTGSTGHVFLIDTAAKRIEPRAPLVAGTEQYEVAVIDTNEEQVGEDDTRLADRANKVKGVGRGTIRLYVDQSGELVGFARNFRSTRRFFSYDPRFPSDTKPRKAAIGRPLRGA
jgi:hypothetical protein